MNTATVNACDTREDAIAWIAKHGEIDDVVTLDAACAIILNLHRVRAEMPECEVRKLHTLVELPQTRALRAMRHLHVAGIITVSDNQHDPLGAFVSLRDDFANKVQQFDKAA
ncbi:hypothetical protein [Pontixanthobacter sp. CEM42]|uniref:hypothetical protein n=1 Tax=Pontixanthobacter sp. CEM42 TaxID=2792077 RepID=UPI001ADF1319|nr:hypothetical protein [Pontixanthobacter sp. CEM42]